MSVARRRCFALALPLAACAIFGLSFNTAAPQTPDISINADLLRRAQQPVEADPSILPIDRAARQRIEAAEDYAKAKSWPEVVRILQPVLDNSEDVLIPAPPKKDDRDTPWVSLRREADRLLAALPEDGRKYYELAYGAKARELLKQARQTTDERLLTEVVQRFAHTEAGAAALDLLGARHLDRGRTGEAAACYRWLLYLPGRTLDDRALYRAWLAFHLHGDADLAEQTWKRLSTQASRGVRIGDSTLSLDRLHREAEHLAFTTGIGEEWTQFRGDLQRSAKGTGGMPLVQPRWRAATAGGGACQAWLAGDTAAIDTQATDALPSFFPVTVGGRLICRGHGGIYAYDLATGRLLWRTPTPLGLDAMLGDPTYNKTVLFKDWAALQANARAQVLHNSTLGTLSSDGSRVYAVEDLVLPPPASWFGGAGQPGQRAGMGALGNLGGQFGLAGGPGPAVQVPPPARVLGPLKDYFYHNRLRALDVATGRVVWEAGGRGGKGLVNDAYFLGPPVPVGGLLYGIIEKKREVRLVCLHPNTGRPVWSQLLAATQEEILQNPVRRGQAALPALGDGILVCPTNTGALVAVDLLSRRLAWAYAYPRNTQTVDVGDQDPLSLPLPAHDSWQAAAPIIHAGKVIYTPPDSDSIYCLDLRDGKELWQGKRADDLYLACIDKDRVFLVGHNACRALSLATGAEVWQTVTGLPSGVGVFADGTYYLPLRKGAVAALDVATGSLRALSQSPNGEIPGNLIAHRGEIVSQTVTGIAVYPQLSTLLAQIDTHLNEHPADTKALLDRAELRLYQGHANEAIADLRATFTSAVYVSRSQDGARARNVNHRAHDLLHDALATLLRQHDDPADQGPILKQISAEWQTLVQTENVESAEHFISLFGDLVPLGMEARLQMAEWWLQDKASGSGLETELSLIRVRDQRADPRLSVRAIEALARLYARKGLPEDAVECYRTLGHNYADTVVRDGRTGGDFFREMSADRRLLPYVDDTGYVWKGGRIKTTILPGRVATPAVFIPIEPEEGEVPSWLRRYQLGIDVNGSKFVLLDRATGAEVWSHRDAGCRIWKDQGNEDSQHYVSVPCRARGHLALVGLGPVLCGFDLLNRRLLWQKSLIDIPSSQLESLAQWPDLYQFEWVGPMSTGCACIHGGTRLYGIDPLHGTVRWMRGDISPDTRDFGDDDHLFLVETDWDILLGMRRDRAIRLRDGAVVRVPEFSRAVYYESGHHDPIGACLFCVSGNDLWLYDAHTGKTVWKKTLGGGNGWSLMHGDDPSLVGVLEKGENVTIFDATSGKELMSAGVNRRDFEKASQITLLHDRVNYYIVVAPPAPHENVHQAFAPNVMHGLHAIPAGGKIYAFDRATGKFKWDVSTLTHPDLRQPPNSGPIQCVELLTDRFDELPVIILTIARQRQNKADRLELILPGGKRGIIAADTPSEAKATAVTVAIDKTTGKMIHAMVHPESKQPYFHAIHGDPRSGTIDLISADRTIRFTREE